MTDLQISTQYEAAKNLYSKHEPLLVGRFVLGQDDIRLLPLNLDDIYNRVFDSFKDNPGKAMAWAKTFGKLSITIALDGSPTTFELDRAKDYPPANRAELITDKPYAISEMFYAEDKDSPFTLVLCDDGAKRTELNLIKALHMVDYGLITGQLSPTEQPEIRIVAATPDELVRISSDFEDIGLRLYGNVRSDKDAPEVLGSVLPSAVLENSQMATMLLNNSAEVPYTLPVSVPTRERINVCAAGVTTAKRPHIGHAFLLAKALSEPAFTGDLVVELNDLGPRVAQAVASFASQNALTFEEAATSISSGAVSIADIEKAYMARDTRQAAQSLPTNFSLRASNRYYENLLTELAPTDTTIRFIANSDLGSLMQELDAKPGSLPVFGDSGMALLTSVENEAVVVKSGGAPTLAGILGSLCTRYDMTFADSPKPLDGRKSKVFAQNGLNIAQVPGMGVSIDFDVASGTKGDSPLIEVLKNVANYYGCSGKDFLLICRSMLEKAYFVPGDGNSLNPNYASSEALMCSFEAAAQNLALGGSNGLDLYKPLKLKRVMPMVAKELLTRLYPTYNPTRKQSPQSLLALLGSDPELGFSEKLRDYAASHPQVDKTIPRTFYETGDYKLLDALRSTTPSFVLQALARKLVTTSEDVSVLLSGSLLQEVQQAMGYEPSQLDVFLAKLQNSKEVYCYDG